MYSTLERNLQVSLRVSKILTPDTWDVIIALRDVVQFKRVCRWTCHGRRFIYVKVDVIAYKTVSNPSSHLCVLRDSSHLNLRCAIIIFLCSLRIVHCKVCDKMDQMWPSCDPRDVRFNYQALPRFAEQGPTLAGPDMFNGPQAVMPPVYMNSAAGFYSHGQVSMLRCRLLPFYLKHTE